MYFTKILLLIILLSLIWGFNQPVEAKWYKSYQQALQAMKKGQYEQAVKLFQEALKEKKRDTDKIRAYGTTFIEYFPHRELGICYFYLGDMERAKRELVLSLQQKATQRAREYLDKINKSYKGTPTPPRERPVITRYEEKPKTRKTARSPKPPVHSPQLSAELFFMDPSNNGFLDAEEECKLVVDIHNTGKGEASGLKIQLSPRRVSGVKFGSFPVIDRLRPSEKKSVVIPMTASATVTSQEIKLRLQIKERNGYDLNPPASITIRTKKLTPPKFKVSVVGLQEPSGNYQIEPNEIAELTVRIQNTGKGDAWNVKAQVQTGNQVFLTPDSKNNFILGNLPSNDFKDIKFSAFISNKQAKKMPITIKLEEARPRFNKNFPLELPLYTEIVAPPETPEHPASKPVQPVVNVDINIPKFKSKNPDAVAVLIGISRYKNRDIPRVDFAENDARVMKKYLIRVLGYDPRRIIEVYDDEASLSTFKRIFEEQLFNWVRSGRSDVFIYYSGHGAPDPESQEAYFVPYDCNPTYAKSTGYKVKEFYERVAKLPARNITVVIDACFSGSSAAGMILKGISPVFIKVQNPIVALNNGVVFTSATGDQVSSWYPQAKHSLFTYYFMRGLRGEADQNKDGSITVEEMETYINTYVPDQARYLNNREQTPQVMAKNKKKILVRIK